MAKRISGDLTSYRGRKEAVEQFGQAAVDHEMAIRAQVGDRLAQHLSETIDAQAKARLEAYLPEGLVLP